MKKSHENSIIVVLTEGDMMRLWGFSLNDMDPNYKGHEYKDTGAEYVDSRRRLFYDNFVILQAEFVEYERYLIEIVDKNDFEGSDSLIDLPYATRFIDQKRVKND